MNQERILQEDALPSPPSIIERRTYGRLRWPARPWLLHVPRLRRMGAIEEEWEVRVNYAPDRRLWYGCVYDEEWFVARLGVRLGPEWDVPFPEVPRPARGFPLAPTYRLGPRTLLPIAVPRRRRDGRVEEAMRVEFIIDQEAAVDRLRLLSRRYVDATPYMEEDD